MIDWERAYDNRAAVPGAEALQAAWVTAAAAFRAAVGDRMATVACGPGPRERLDLFRPAGETRGLAVFVHGGYWQRNDRDLFSHLAAGALAAGWAVAMPGYALCPEVRLATITGQVARAIVRAAALVPGPIRIAGHSAGGHLAARMATAGALPVAVAARVTGVLAISGLHDLRPLMLTPLQAALGLDGAEARAESPALLEPLAGIGVTAWVGAEELPELRRQSRLLATIWGGLGVPVRLVEEAARNHFTVIAPLADPASPVTAAWIG